MGKLLLIFDGFDEMAARVDKQQMINNFWELAKVVVPGSKVILTCRTEHFPEAREGRSLLNAELQASTKGLTGETPQFEVLELEKFEDEQIRSVLLLQSSAATVEQVMGNAQLLDLARRPVMTELILEALPDIEAGKPVDMSRVYLYAVRRKMERDIKAERTFTSMADKLYFLCELSWEMLSTDRMSINYREFPDRIRTLFGAVVQEEKDLDHWHYDMMGQTMLIRNSDGDYTPAHRSLLEFFVAFKFAAELGALAPDFLELAQMKSGIDRSLEPRDYTWSEYFGINNNTFPLHRFLAEPMSNTRKTFGEKPISKAIIELMKTMIVPFLSSENHPLKEIILSTRNIDDDENSNFTGGNAATLLIKINRSAFASRTNHDLTKTNLLNADFSNADLRNSDFSYSNLLGASFTRSFGAIFAMAYSPDGNILATAGATCIITLWKGRDYQPILRIKGHADWIRSLQFSANGKFILSASFDRTIKIWDVQNGNCIMEFKGHSNRVNSAVISDDCAIVASASDDSTIKIWDIETGNCINTLSGHTNSVESVIIHRNSQTIISGSSDFQIKLWNLFTGENIGCLSGHSSRIRSLALSPNGNILASGSGDSEIKLWNLG